MYSNLDKSLSSKERATIESRKRRNWQYRDKRPIYIPCVSRGIPHPQATSIENLFEMYLEIFDDFISECIENERPICAEELKKIKAAYGQEISSLIGSWSDEALRYVAQLGNRDAEKKYRQLDALRKSNLAYYF
ncbi:MAG: hypothetical protein WCX74_04080 [Candidatus Paceibacterota bacterium]